MILRPSDRKVTVRCVRLLAQLYFCGRELGLCLPLFSLDPLFVCNRDEGEEEPVVAHRSRTRTQKPVRHNRIIGHILLDFCVRSMELSLTIVLFLRVM